MVSQIYPNELQLSKASSSDTEALFLNLDVSIKKWIVPSEIYDQRNDFNFEIVNFKFLDGDVPFFPSYGDCSLQQICFGEIVFLWWWLQRQKPIFNANV